MRKLMRIALEEDSSGKANKEIEYTFYGRLTDMSILEKAVSSEHHEQWEIRIPKTAMNAGKGTQRIRKTITYPDGKPEYVLTTKTNLNGDGDRLEVSVPTTEANFVQYRVLSDKGMIKDRYHFPVEGSDLVFEVDVFLLPGSEVGSKQYYPWVKIDLEVPDRQVQIPPLPFEMEDLITAQFGNRTETEEAQIRSLYDNEFATKNLYIKKEQAK